MKQPDFAFHVASISPLYGIGSGSWVAFIFAASMAAIFFGLLLKQEHLVWESLVFREIAKQDELADGERVNPFM